MADEDVVMVKSTRVRSMRRILILLMCRIRIGYYRYTRGDSFDSRKITEGKKRVGLLVVKSKKKRTFVGACVSQILKK